MTALASELAVPHLAWVLDQPALTPEVVRAEVLLALGEARRDSGNWDVGGDAFEGAAKAAVDAGNVECASLSATPRLATS